MKLMHLADLHLGKRLHEFSLLEDQRDMWRQICTMIEQEQPDALILAGDIYDKPVPSAEAVQLFDQMLSWLTDHGCTVLMISGNHDSAERLAFGAHVMSASHIHISPVFRGTLEPVVLSDEFGEVRFYLLPFVRPAQVRPYYPREKIEDYQNAVRVILEHTPLDPAVRNVMVTHQFVEGAALYGTEERAVGGTDQICAELFEPFDYTALGHLHRSQAVGMKKIRYAGSPLPYSLAEAEHEKSVTMVELLEKGSLRVNTLPLRPLHAVREIRGTYMEVTARAYYEGTHTDDYLRITLTDEEDIPDAVGRLRSIYPRLLRLDYDNCRTRKNQQITVDTVEQQHTPLDYFASLYERQNNQPMRPEQEAFLKQLIAEIWEEEEA